MFDALTTAPRVKNLRDLLISKINLRLPLLKCAGSVLAAQAGERTLQF